MPGLKVELGGPFVRFCLEDLTRSILKLRSVQLHVHNILVTCSIYRWSISIQLICVPQIPRNNWGPQKDNTSLRWIVIIIIILILKILHSPPPPLLGFMPNCKAERCKKHYAQFQICIKYFCVFRGGNGAKNYKFSLPNRAMINKGIPSLPYFVLVLKY